MKKSRLKRFFKPRDLFVRDTEGVFFCALTSKRQVALSLLLGAAAAWSVFATGYFLYHDAAFADNRAALTRAKNENARLQGEIAAFAEHLDKVAAAVDDNQAAVDDLRRSLDGDETGVVRKANGRGAVKNDTKDQNAQVLAENAERLKSETALVRERLNRLTDGDDAVRDALSYHKIALQRDVAEAQANTLRRKVRSLEKQISDMQETQFLVFRKMASLADGNVDWIENNLDGIKQSLAATGLGMESLLNRIRRDKENVGIGGPFIPAPAAKPQHRLNVSLVSLNSRLDRWYDLTTLQNTLPIGKPIDRIRVTSPFGSRGDPFQGAPAHHEAVDLGGMTGEPVRTTAPGKVVRAGRWGWYGNMVEIDHGMGFRTRYAHLDKILVTQGDTVRAGDKIGTVGNSGRSTGPHLHYEIRVRGQAVDPMKFIKAKKNVFKS